MLHVLRHYLPFRKSLLILSETVLLTVIVAAGMSSHLWRPSDATLRMIVWDGLDPEQARWRCLFSALVVSVVAQFAIAFNELYDFRISSSRYDRAARFMTSAGGAVVMVLALLGLAEMWDIDRVFSFPGLPFSQRVVLLTTTLGLGFALLYLWRNLFHFVLRRTSFDDRLLILGSGRLARRLVADLLERPHSGHEIVGLLAYGGDRRRRADRAGDTEGARPPADTGNPWFEAARSRGGPQAARATEAHLRAVPPPSPARAADAAPRLLHAFQLRELEQAMEPDALAAATPVEEPLEVLARRLDVDRIVVAFEERRGSLPTDELLRCRLQGVLVEEAESFYESVTGKIPAEAMRPSYLIFNPGFVQHPLAATGKRLLDLVLSLVGIVLTAPLMVLTALLVRLDSPGPVLYRQVRTGRYGQPFTLCKFRSMRADAEKLTGPVWAQEDDPRITRVGHFLRKSRLDELPQLFNVLVGTMSMVGPRPERPKFVEELAEKIPYYHQRHIVKPGVTGWAQINYPYGSNLEDALQKLQYDLFYIKYQSLVFDLSIVFNTIKTVLLRKGT